MRRTDRFEGGTAATDCGTRTAVLPDGGRPTSAGSRTIAADVSAYQPVATAATSANNQYQPMRRTSDGRTVLLWRATAAVPSAEARAARAALAALPGRQSPPGVATVLDAGLDFEGRPWLVIPDLTTLASALADSGPPQLPVVGRIVATVAHRVAALRRTGLSVGTISPHRVFFDSQAAVWIAPPLPAELLHLDEPDPRYTAPELLAGEDPTARSDVYGLAATTFALLAGAPPSGDDPTEAALRALTANPPEIPRADIPPAVRDLVRRGLARDPAARPEIVAFGEQVAAAFAETSSHSLQSDPAQVATLPPTSPPTVAEPMGRPLGSRYVLDEPIGSGVSGRVWRGRRRDDGSPVAVKVLREEYTRDPTSVVRFMRERTTLRAFDHPHLVRVHDLVAEGDTLAIVMDLVDGDDLRAVMRRQPLTPDEVVTVLSQVANALAAVHAGGVVHRDVKPENVLVTRRPTGPWAWLTDFGLARATDGPALTRMSQLVGTPAYVAPELVAGRPPSPASDVYALGVAGYELLTGRRPFDAPTTAALLRAHLDVEPVRPAELTDAAWEVLAACLAKEPERRPSASDAAEAFASLRGRLTRPATAVPTAETAHRAGTSPTTASGADTSATSVPSGPDTGPSHLPLVTSPPDASTAGSTGASSVAQPTVGATRPMVAAPETTAPRKRRRWVWVVAVLTCLVVGVVAGVVASLNRPPPPATKPAPSTPAGPAPQLYFLAVTATSPAPGKVRLQFSDAEGIEGFAAYVVYRDIDLYDQYSGAEGPPLELSNIDTTTRHCYRVAALVTSTAPPPPTPSPACVVANGRPQ